MISIHTWVYEDGEVNISVNIERRRNALNRKPKLSAVEKIALLSMIAEELDERFPETEANRLISGTIRVPVNQQQVAGVLTDLRGETATDWDRAKSHPFVPDRT